MDWCPTQCLLAQTASLQDQQQQKGLLQALLSLVTLRKLDTSVPQGPESQLQLLATSASLLVDAGILGLAGGMYLKTCLTDFAPHFKGDVSAELLLLYACIIHRYWIPKMVHLHSFFSAESRSATHPVWV